MPGKPVGQHLTACGVLLQQPHVVVRLVLLQYVRHVVPHPAAADDEHPARRVRHDAQQMQVVPEEFALADHEQVVVGLDHRAAGRDQGLPTPLYGGNEKGGRALPDAGDVAQPVADDRRLSLHPEDQELHAPFEKVGGLLRARRPDQPADFLRHGLTRIDQQVDADVLAGLHERRLPEIRLVDARDAAGHPGLTGQKTRHQVHLVRAGDRDQHVRAVDLGVLEHLRARRVASEGQDVQLILHPLDELRRVIDDDHVMLLADQAAGDVIADLSGAKNDDAQNDVPSWLCSGRPKPAIMPVACSGDRAAPGGCRPSLGGNGRCCNNTLGQVSSTHKGCRFFGVDTARGRSIIRQTRPERQTGIHGDEQPGLPFLNGNCLHGTRCPRPGFLGLGWRWECTR